jgi:hypothetical protein
MTLQMKKSVCKKAYLVFEGTQGQTILKGGENRGKCVKEREER